MNKSFAKNIKTTKGDALLIIAVTLLSIIGTIFIYSASRYSALKTYGDALYFVKKQIVGIVLGVIAMIVLGNIDFMKLKKICPYLSIISIVLLLLIFVPGLGVENYGARRWIKVGPITIQPSEISKLALILFCATYASRDKTNPKKFKGILPILSYGGLTCLLIMLEPNMSITVCVAMLTISMAFISGARIKTLLMLGVPLVVGAIVLIIIEPYRLNRLMAFINPWSNPKGEGYQLLQSLYALGSGGWFGVGLFNSRQKYAFLPFAESDFILSVIGEEIGFIGLFFFFALIGFIIYRGLRIASKTNNFFGFCLSVGITLIFAIQAIVNALVVTGSIPPTGLPLPLVSSGNTSIIIFMSEMGVLYNVSKSNSLTF